MNRISRRQFLKYSALMSASATAPVFLGGCAVNPVTGRTQLMMVSRQQEIELDKKQSPFQFSSDYGITQDKKINQYMSCVGEKLLANVQRPDMPYNFQCVNATYINAYAFPGGSIAATRGILLKLENEAQLASLLGHELGHVNARHTAEQISKGRLSSLIVGGLTLAASYRGEGLGEIAQKLGMLGQGLLLSKYSRDNERQADTLGNEYMVEAGYSSRGFTGLMEMLNSLHKEQPSSVKILFSSHPMSSERLNSALQREKGIYRYTKDYPINRERYMDNMASLFKKKEGIKLLQQGEKYLEKKDYEEAGNIFKKSLKKLKNDYTAHVLMSKCLMIREKPAKALIHANIAKKLYPSEVQAYHIAGIANIKLKQYTKAYKDFCKSDELLPGNPQMTFYKGYCLDKQGNPKPAARNYMTYLKMINYKSGKYSRYAYNRLKQWGYAK
ncbi:MAG: M48 family metalloprotease [Deltaproteobacteria bacterium]|nr:M48 family metalloprotease [Deltaproteobacteria bacterium]